MKDLDEILSRELENKVKRGNTLYITHIIGMHIIFKKCAFHIELNNRDEPKNIEIDSHPVRSAS